MRERVVEALGTRQNDAIILALKARAVEDAHSHVRTAALETLAAYDDNSLAAFFKNRYESEDSPLAKAAAATGLGLD